MTQSQSAGGVVIVGSINIDLTTYSPRKPAPGETILGDDFQVGLGGKGANQAVAVAMAGGNSHMVGVVGTDAFGDEVLASLAHSGVTTDRVRRHEGQTGVAHIRVDAAGENDIVVVPLANDHLLAADIDASITALAPTCSVMLTQLEIPFALTMHAIRSARAAGMTVVLDPAPAHTLDEAIWPLIDVVKPNETEASLLTGIAVTDRASAELAAHWFLERGVGAVIVTLAGEGSLLVTDAGSQHVEAFSVEVVDTTAAGDAYAGALSASLAAGADLPTAIRTASATGAITVTRRGASTSIPTAAEVSELLAAQQQSEAS